MELDLIYLDLRLLLLFLFRLLEEGRGNGLKSKENRESLVLLDCRFCVNRVSSWYALIRADYGNLTIYSRFRVSSAPHTISLTFLVCGGSLYR